MPDTTAYYRVAEIIRELEGDSAAQHFLDTHDSDKVVLIEDTIKITGEVERFVNGISVGRSNNQVQAGLGQIFARGLRIGYCDMISAMTILLNVSPNPTQNMTAPVRTAGGRGATDYVTVQSTWTNILADIQVLNTKLFASSRNIALQTSTFIVPVGDTYQCNWSIYVGGTYSNDQRYSMAQSISPEVGYGGTMYKLAYGKFTNGAGFVTSGIKKYTGGDGNALTLLCECDYIHSGANDTITRFDVLNSNMDVVTSKTGLAIPVVAGDIVNAFHYVVFPTL